LLAGPVFAAAVVLPTDFFHPLLNDSKQIKEKDRYTLREVIIKESVEWAVGSVDHAEIDQINILYASFKAMHLALDQLYDKPGLILVDGNRFTPYPRIPHQTIVKGDSIYASIAAASILAKTFRDDHMLTLHQSFPQYDWKQNKGYPTEFHRRAIITYGLSPFHRRSFHAKSPDEE
jgi:ribonuclease HII